MLMPLFFLFLITYFLKPRLRLGILLVLALPLTILAEGNFDVPSVGVYLVFLNTTFVVTVRNGSSERLGFSRKTIPIQS
jgi:hypothetical protein